MLHHFKVHLSVVHFAHLPVSFPQRSGFVMCCFGHGWHPLPEGCQGAVVHRPILLDCPYGLLGVPQDIPWLYELVVWVVLLKRNIVLQLYCVFIWGLNLVRLPYLGVLFRFGLVWFWRALSLLWKNNNVILFIGVMVLWFFGFAGLIVLFWIDIVV